MKNIKIKYNPYYLKTDITIDGEKPKLNSSLNVNGFYLQEWIEKLPDIIIEEFRDNEAVIEFTGTEADFEDIQAVLNATKDKFKAEASLSKTADISDVEDEIDAIWKNINEYDGIPELHDKIIVEAFQKAKDSKFEINVVGTMSSGKSTLINALLGKKLMPAAQTATTATIVRIIAADQETFSAIAYDKSGNVVKQIDDVTLEIMQNLNNDPSISTIEILGKIPFVKTAGMKLVLVDTPGPNNSRDNKHREMTERMIQNSDNSLVLYIMNGEQLGINDDKLLLDSICDEMGKKGKKSRERFLFIMNKMDSFNPDSETDGSGCVERELKKAKIRLEEKGIYNPNIFPVCSLPILQQRANLKGLQARELRDYKEFLEVYDEMRFESYRQFNNLPLSICEKFNKILNGCNDEEVRVEVHSGILSIEQAIVLYISKYARTIKIKNLIESFNNNLKELAVNAHIEKAIREDNEVKAALEEQIAKIKKNIQSAQNAQELSKSINNIDLRNDIKNELKTYMDAVNGKISKIISVFPSEKIEKSEALEMCNDLEKELKNISTQVKVQIEKIVDKAYKITIEKVIDEYKKYLKDLNISIKSSDLEFNVIEFVSSALPNMTTIVNSNIETEVESEKKRVRKEGGFIRKTLSVLTLGLIKDYTEEVKWEEKLVDKVSLKEVADDYITPYLMHLMSIHNCAIDHISSETERLKQHLKGELNKIDKVLNNKLDALTKTESDSMVKAAEIAQKENNLRWLESIQKRVNDIIEF